jgi:hypothetical protein
MKKALHGSKNDYLDLLSKICGFENMDSSTMAYLARAIKESKEK